MGGTSHRARPDQLPTSDLPARAPLSGFGGEKPRPGAQCDLTLRHVIQSARLVPAPLWTIHLWESVGAKRYASTMQLERGMPVTTNAIAAGERFTLARPTIEVAAAEIRLTSGLADAEEDLALSLREALRATGLPFNVISPAARQEVSLSMSPTGGQAVQGTSIQGWTFNDEAAQLQVTWLPDVLLVQSSTYTHFSETLKPVLDAALQWLDENGQVHLRTRAGLRYVNRLVDESATAPQAWHGRVEDWLLGQVITGPWANRVEQAHQQLHLRNEDSTNTALRHGPFRDAASRNNFSYLLDLDVFDASTESFRPSSTLELLTRLNYTAATVYRGTLTPEFLEQLGIAVESAARGEEDR